MKKHTQNSNRREITAVIVSLLIIIGFGIFAGNGFSLNDSAPTEKPKAVDPSQLEQQKKPEDQDAKNELHTAVKSVQFEDDNLIVLSETKGKHPQATCVMKLIYKQGKPVTKRTIPKVVDEITSCDFAIPRSQLSQTKYELILTVSSGDKTSVTKQLVSF